MKEIRMLIVGVIVVYLIVCMVMYILQRSLLFFPTREVNDSSTPVQYFDIEGERIKVWQLNAGKRDAIIYFGGNAENVAQNIVTYSQLFPEHTVYLVNYRGYGGSSGTPSEQALFSDAVAIFDAVSAQYNSVAAIGRSLGSGVAVHLAAQRRLEKIALITPYDSIKSIAKDKYFWVPVSILLKDHFDSVAKAPKLDIPVLVLSAENDSLIPFKHTQRLIDAINPKILDSKVFKNTSHNDIELGKGYFAILNAFLHK